jgi:hypothetical protein
MRPHHKEEALNVLINGFSDTVPSAVAYERLHPTQKWDVESYWQFFIDDLSVSGLSIVCINLENNELVAIGSALEFSVYKAKSGLAIVGEYMRVDTALD